MVFADARGPHRRAARALRAVRRRGAERLPRPARRAGGGPARPRRPPAGGAARRASSRPRPRSSTTWDALPAGAAVLAEAGARPADRPPPPSSTCARRPTPSLDVHRDRRRRGAHDRAAGGELRASRCGSSAGQDPQEIAAALEALLRDALPEGAELELHDRLAAPVALRPRQPRRCGRARRAGARLRPRAGAGALRRHAADPRRVRRARHPRDRLRLRAAGGQLPRARRVLPRSPASSSAGAPRGRCTRTSVRVWRAAPDETDPVRRPPGRSRGRDSVMRRRL